MQQATESSSALAARSVLEELDRCTTREWLALPAWVRLGIREYVATGYVEHGTTLHAALCNNFTLTTCMAGDDLSPCLRELAVSISCYIPSVCHGSTAAVAAWAAKGGLTYLMENHA